MTIALKPTKPILKWAGGKTQHLDEIVQRAPKSFDRYVEPFLGGAAVFLGIAPKQALLSDNNSELIDFYETVRERPLDLLHAYRGMVAEEEEYYRIRALDPATLDEIERASRFLYLNKTCYNGLYRVNRQGKFNTPYGKRDLLPEIKERDIVAVAELLALSEIKHSDFRSVLTEDTRPGDFIYLDPPYIPSSQYSDFKRYTKEQFSLDDHRELAEITKWLIQNDRFVLVSNSDTDLVRELYAGLKIDVLETRRNINKNASGRRSTEVIISPRKIEYKTVASFSSIEETLPLFTHNPFPPTRFMGSKAAILDDIWSCMRHFEFDSVLDLFSGSGVVSHRLKAEGKSVVSNDYMSLSYVNAHAMVENDQTLLTESDLSLLNDTNSINDNFVENKFRGLYFSDEDNQFIDLIRSNLSKLDSEYKVSIAKAALARACMKKRPRGIFTYTGMRYDDGRRDLRLSLREQFLEAVEAINRAVFTNGKKHKALNGDALDVNVTVDAIYLDPPYYSPLSDNEYVRRYHFVEGLVRDWQGVDIQEHTKTKKFKSYPTPFSTREGALLAFENLFQKYSESVIFVSYSSNSQPTREEIAALLGEYKPNVEVVLIDHTYHFGNQGHLTERPRNKVQEYLFIGHG